MYSHTRFDAKGEWFPTKTRKLGGFQNTNTNKFRGIKCYDNDNRMSWMDSSIDLSQPEIVKIGKRPDPAEISTRSNFNENNSFRRSCGFIPLHHPYEWSAQKNLHPIKGNPLMRISENVKGKVTLIFSYSYKNCRR